MKTSQGVELVEPYDTTKPLRDKSYVLGSMHAVRADVSDEFMLRRHERSCTTARVQYEISREYCAMVYEIGARVIWHLMYENNYTH